MRIILMLFSIILIQSAVARQLRLKDKKKYESNRTANLNNHRHVSALAAIKPTELEIDALKCPLHCVCQYAHFIDLPIARWIDYLQKRKWRGDSSDKMEESVEELIKDNEALYDGDEIILFNPLIKQATCILQVDDDPVVLVNSLPHDLQALILLYTGIGYNKTVNTSILKPLNQLTTLEIRGTQDYTFKLIFDEPLRFLLHANFDSIILWGSDNLKRPKNPIHPSDNFDYKPKSDLRSIQVMKKINVGSNDKSLLYKLVEGSNEHLEDTKDNFEILSYEDYMLEVEKSRRVNFYGWEHLKVLRIHSCKLNKLRWEMFDGLEALENLSLERNDIEVVPPFALYGTRNIKTLSLAHNRIQDLQYRALAGLLELKLLDLKDNRLTKLSELSFPPFPKLQRVDFRKNPIKYIFPATFLVMNMTRIMHMESQEQAIEIVANMPFDALNELKELLIGNMTISSLEQNMFKGLNSLQKLKLGGNIPNIEFDAFAALTELQELDISNCHVREISMDGFMGCKKLKVIDMSYNNLNSIPMGLFDDQSLLEEIYLQHNQLSTLPNTLFMLPKLRLARLTDNPWKCSCDMRTWRSKITNQERGPRINRCITDFMTGREIGCRKVDSYELNMQYAPRCENFNGRSVFYVLRKQLQCGSGRVVQLRRTNHKLTQIVGNNSSTNFDYLQKEQHLSRQAELHIHTQTRYTQIKNRLRWQIERHQKIHRNTSPQKNSLDYLLRHDQKKLTLAKQRVIVKSTDATAKQDEPSNEI